MSTKVENPLLNPRFRIAYQKHERHFTQLDPVSMTHQSFADELDINNIVRRHDPSILERPSEALWQFATQGHFQDCSEPYDYKTALEIVMSAEDAFADLPAVLRAQFDNDPGRVIAFMADPANHEECVKLGLAIPKVNVTTGELIKEES